MARKVGDQTMVRIAVQGMSQCMPNTRTRGKGAPKWSTANQALGTKEFGAIDPNGVCVTFQES